MEIIELKASQQSKIFAAEMERLRSKLFKDLSSFGVPESVLKAKNEKDKSKKEKS